jgi:hypothetical protein
MKELTQQDRAELARLRARLLLTLDFVENVEGDDEFGQQIRGVVESTFAKGKLRAMRLLARDIDAFATALPSHHREGLEALLHARLGIDKDAERAVVKKQVTVALKRGRIASEKERHRLQEYADMLEAEGGHTEEVDAVARLLRTT